MKILGYIDDGLTIFFNWQFSHWYIAIPMVILELIIFFWIIEKFKTKTPL